MSPADMATRKAFPERGQWLQHKFRRGGEIVYAQVVHADPSSNEVHLRVNGTTYTSLSQAAKAVSGYTTNGWVFWGLKAQIPPQKGHA